MDKLPYIKRGILNVLEMRKLSPSNDMIENFLISSESIYTFNFKNVDYIILIQCKKVGKEDITSLYQFKGESRNNIMIIGESLTPQGRNELLGAIKNSEAVIEFWNFREILINPLTHSMAPKYTILSQDQQKKEIIPLAEGDRFFTRSMEGFRDDIAVKWLGAKVGDIIRIERYNNIMKSKITAYRIVRKTISF